MGKDVFELLLAVTANLIRTTIMITEDSEQKKHNESVSVTIDRLQNFVSVFWDRSVSQFTVHKYVKHIARKIVQKIGGSDLPAILVLALKRNVWHRNLTGFRQLKSHHEERSVEESVLGRNANQA